MTLQKSQIRSNGRESLIAGGIVKNLLNKC
nr:MAG TPA: hypothetical protein [Caudoviricetes sp.]